MTWPEPGGEAWEEGDWRSPGEGGWEAGGAEDDAGMAIRWPLHWRGLYPQERWLWFEHLWSEVCMLRDRYRLAVRAGWWENEVQLETLAALSAWVDRYDCGEWDDPPGKLALLYDLERVAGLLRDGADPFHPQRDRPAFVRHLLELGCQPPPCPWPHEAADHPPHAGGEGRWSRRNGSESARNGFEPPEDANGVGY